MLRPKQSGAVDKQFSFLTTVLVFALTVWMALPTSDGQTPGFALGTAGMQHGVPPLDPVIEHLLHAGGRWHQLPAGDPDLVH